MNVIEQNTLHIEQFASPLGKGRTKSSNTRFHFPFVRAVGVITPLVGRIAGTILLLFLSILSFAQTTVTFNYTGAVQNWVVPAGVTTVTINTWGAQGGDAGFNNVGNAAGGLGGFASGELSVTPGEVLAVYVGGMGGEIDPITSPGQGGFNGGGDGSEIHNGYFAGGGGGASDVRQGGVALTSRVIVGSGGGGAWDGIDGGNGGGLTGAGSGGAGGTQSAGGSSGGACAGDPQLDGQLGQGGGVPAGCVDDSGGGGGGYYGGGAGIAGGGGSGYIGGVINGSMSTGVQSGDGLVQILVPDCLNESYSCDDEVTITLDVYPTCSVLVEPADVLNNLDPIDGVCFDITLSTDIAGNDPLLDAGGNPLVPANLITPDYAGTTVYAMVMNTATGQMKCMGIKINVVDGQNPSITCPPTADINCGDSTDPSNTGTPTVTDCTTTTLTYVDSAPVAGTCENGILEFFTRTWTVTDAAGKTATCTQTININRIDADLFVIPGNADVDCNAGNPDTSPSNTGVPLGPGGENALDVAAACDLIVTFTDDTLSQTSCAGFNIIKRTWMVLDDCGNMSFGFQIIKVVDNVAPVITCPTTVDTISTDPYSCTGTTDLLTLTVVEECSGYTTTTTATNGTIVGNEISGLPLGTTTVTVIATDGCGNADTCSYEIFVEDQIAPTPICETEHTISLTNSEPTLVPAIVFDDGSYDYCGPVTFQVRRMEGDSCSFIDATTYGPTVPFYCCDIGDTIMVELLVTDAAGNTNSCMSEVYVQDKLKPVITCPADITVDCGDDPTDLSITGEATATDNCSSLVPTYTDDGSFNDCGIGMITRTWIVVDPFNNADTCEQKITGANPNPFSITDTDCTNVNPNDGVIWPCNLMNITACGNDGSLSPASLEALGYTSAQVRPQLFPNGCDVDMVVATYTDSEDLSGPNACRKYFRLWKVYSWCSLTPTVPVATYTQVIMVISSASPDIISSCSALPVQFPAVSDLTIEVEDDCTPTEDLDISYEITLADATVINGTGDDASGSYPVGVHSIMWTILDDCGQEATCTYNFTVNSAPPSATISGGIENEEGDEVEHVLVEVSGDMTEQAETTEAGVFSFDLPTASNYAITPERDDNPLNGVSTFDLVKISQHILESESLATPYKMIAADVNRSGSITTVDLVELRKLILFIDTEFANNTSWRFVDADFVFPNPLNPFQTSFPEVYTINDLENDMLADFVGVKVGDVNCSAAANDFAGSSDDRNSGADLVFYVDDQSLTAGETYTIDFDIDDVNNLQGYQFTLAFDQGALYFENLTTGTLEGITENNFGLSLLDKGAITTSWNTVGMFNTEKGTSFSVTFTALVDAKLSEVININSRYTKAQAYINNESTNVSLAFETENGIALDHFQLFQNRPNPFKGETVISFNLPEDNAGTLTIYDLSGRVIKVVQQNFNGGYNEVGISSADLTGHGVFYYQLEVADQIATRRMVLLK